MEMKASAIIQARFGASRLPGKVLLEILGKTILEYVIERVKKAKYIENVIVATSVNKEDLKIADLADRLKVKVYRGSEEDVLDRFYQAAKVYKIEHIVRITADCPLIDPDIIDRAVNLYFESGSDYCSNTLDETFPDGEDVEVFSVSALNRAWKEAYLLSEREHVTPYIKKHSEKFKLVSFRNEENLSDKRWTLDEERDFKFIKTVLEALYPVNPDFHMGEILDIVKRNPRLEDINRSIIRNEGYLKSLARDKLIK
jgi:spore coat polysaccharide biosynthesis protein SpsF (cytidylyltransferase family)